MVAELGATAGHQCWNGSRDGMMTELDLLRARLVALRRSTLDRLAEVEVIDGGLLAIVAHASATLAALEEAEAADKQHEGGL